MKPIARRIEILETGLAPAEPMPPGLDDQQQLLWALGHGFTLSELVTESMRLEAANDRS